jgi:hypothetical protein
MQFPRRHCRRPMLYHSHPLHLHRRRRLNHLMRHYYLPRPLRCLGLKFPHRRCLQNRRLGHHRLNRRYFQQSLTHKHHRHHLPQQLSRLGMNYYR